MGWIGYNFKENFIELHVFMHATSFVGVELHCRQV